MVWQQTPWEARTRRETGAKLPPSPVKLCQRAMASLLRFTRGAADRGGRSKGVPLLSCLHAISCCSAASVSRRLAASAPAPCRLSGERPPSTGPLPSAGSPTWHHRATGERASRGLPPSNWTTLDAICGGPRRLTSWADRARFALCSRPRGMVPRRWPWQCSLRISTTRCCRAGTCSGGRGEWSSSTCSPARRRRGARLDGGIA
jgi:hypothetical protein